MHTLLLVLEYVTGMLCDTEQSIGGGTADDAYVCMYGHNV